jgi:hypothetical protein
MASSCSNSVPFTVVSVSSRIYEEIESMRGLMSFETDRQSAELSLVRCPVTKTIVILAFIVVVLWQAPTLHAETTYYVQSAKAKVMSGATFTSTVLGEVDRGYEFLSSGTEGRWVKVKYKNGEGYVHSFVLLLYPPIENVSAITADEQEIRRGFRRRVSSPISSEAQGGLDRKEPGHDEKADYESLEKIELFTMSSREIRRFMEGKQ